MTTTLRARFDGTVLIPLDPVDFPVGTELDIEARERSGGPARGSPAALLRAMSAAPHLEPGDADALEQAIGEGRLPVRAAGAFDEAGRP